MPKTKTKNTKRSKKVVKTRPQTAKVRRTPAPTAGVPVLRTAPVRTRVRRVNEASIRGGEDLSKAIFETDTISEAPRWPDPFTMIPTATAITRPSYTLTISNGASSANGSTSFIFNGSGLSTICHSQTIGADSAITWNSGTTVNCGLCTASYESRPVGANVVIDISTPGDPHAVTVCGVPVPPTTMATLKTLAYLPANAALGLDAAQRNYGGKQVEITSTDSVALSCLPVDSESLFFETSNAERGDNSWMGWAIWMYGLRSTDTVRISVSFAEEWYCTVPVTGTFTLADLAVSVPNHARLDAALQKTEKRAKSGHGFVKFLKGAARFVGKVVNVAEKIIPIVTKIVGDPGTMVAHYRRHPELFVGPPGTFETRVMTRVPAQPSEPPEEKFETVTPRHRFRTDSLVNGLVPNTKH